MQTFRQRGETAYCVVGVHYSDRQGAQILAIESRMIVFDTLRLAQSTLPRLGGAGRRSHWLDVEQECIAWMPINPDPKAFNRAVILTGYDPYNIPASGVTGMRSEARGLDWRHHILFHNVLEEVLNVVDGVEMARKRRMNQIRRVVAAGGGIGEAPGRLR